MQAPRSPSLRALALPLSVALLGACGEPPATKLPEGPAPEYEPSRGTTAPRPGASADVGDKPAPVATSAPSAPATQAPLEPPP